MAKKTKPSYEAFCKCFAGVFKKHAHDSHRSLFTCYIRDYIHDYLGASDDRRSHLMENAAGEEAIGCLIAKALLRQGWDEGTIAEYADEQQRIVTDAEEYSGMDFTGGLEVAGYSDDRFNKKSNGRRYAWLMDGGPSITQCLDPYED